MQAASALMLGKEVSIQTWPRQERQWTFQKH